MALPKEKSQKETNYLKKIYTVIGEPKIGKTTIASQFGDEKNKVLFFACEAGHKEQEIYKWYVEETVDETDFKTGEVTEITIQRDPSNWMHFKQCVMEMTKQNDFKCLVIDTADNLFTWCQAHVRRRDGFLHESDLGFGKAYDMVKKEFEAPLAYLSQKGFGIVFISHAKESEVEEKNRKFRKIDSSMSNTAKKVIQPLSDYILYFHLGENGERLIRTKATPSIVAGDRSGRLPELLPMDAKLLIRELSKPEIKQTTKPALNSERDANV